MHRSAAALLMEGRSASEIAKVLQIPEDKVRALLKQPHTQEAIRELSKGIGGEAVENVLKAVELDAVLQLVELMQTAESESVRFNAAKEIINKRRGNVPIRKPDEDEEVGGSLDVQIDSLDKKIAALTAKIQLGEKKNDSGRV